MSTDKPKEGLTSLLDAGCLLASSAEYGGMGRWRKRMGDGPSWTQVTQPVAYVVMAWWQQGDLIYLRLAQTSYPAYA